MADKCTTCGTPLNEIPLVNCQEHQDCFLAQPQLTRKEIIEASLQELDEILYGRTGDD